MIIIKFFPSLILLKSLKSLTQRILLLYLFFLISTLSAQSQFKDSFATK